MTNQEIKEELVRVRNKINNYKVMQLAVTYSSRYYSHKEKDDIIKEYCNILAILREKEKDLKLQLK